MNLQLYISETEEKGNYRLSPHLLRHSQWNVCEHGTVTSPVTAESMRSRQTGHVGNSKTGVFAEPSLDRASGTESSASMLMDVI
jgi:hypothetical protein